MTNEDRLAHHLTTEFGARSLGSFTRNDLQTLLDRKGQTLSFSVVDHLRWDLKQIFDMAVAEGYLQRNPAALLFTPRECKRAVARVMTVEDVRRMFRVLEVRERLVAKLALLVGMRPGEIFGLKWSQTRSRLRGHPAAGLSGGCGLTQIGPVGASCGPVRWAAYVH